METKMNCLRAPAAEIIAVVAGVAPASALGRQLQRRHLLAASRVRAEGS